ncbi:MAG: hypothetical protein KGI60_00430 [Patescibacteria group bacterium]|nr:hypothetical protein [Patescibacteria group bacterium]
MKKIALGVLVLGLAGCMADVRQDAHTYILKEVPVVMTGAMDGNSSASGNQLGPTVEMALLDQSRPGTKQLTDPEEDVSLLACASTVRIEIDPALSEWFSNYQYSELFSAERVTTDATWPRRYFASGAVVIKVDDTPRKREIEDALRILRNHSCPGKN